MARFAGFNADKKVRGILQANLFYNRKRRLRRLVKIITNLVLSASAITENGTGGELVGTLSIVGPDFTGPVTYSITSDPSLKFEIAGAGLDELRVKAATTIDFETNPSFSIGLQGIDSTAGTPKTFTKTTIISVIDINEAPTDIILSTNSIPENALPGLIIGVLSTLDPDTGNIFTYSIDLDADAKFAISGSNLVVRAGAIFDFEAVGGTSHDVTIRSTDAGGLSFAKTLTVAITNINEAPTSVTLTLSGSPVLVTDPPGKVIGTLSTTDPDASNTFIYTITGP